MSARDGKDGDVSRRQFFRTAAGVGAIATARPAGAQLFEFADDEEEERKIRSHRRLGRTDLQVSDVSLGTYGVSSPEVIAAALDAGINYIDTGPTYGNAETIIGETLRRQRGKKERVHVATRWYTKPGLPAVMMLRSLDQSLSRLRLQSVDVIFVGSAQSVEQIRNPGLHEAFAKAKEAGKARFLGVASHAANLEQVLTYAVESGKFDVIMPSYNFMRWKGLKQILEQAKARDIGVVAMKTLAGARKAKAPGLKGRHIKPAIAWALKNSAVASACVTIKNLERLRDALGASGAKLTREGREILRRYARANSGTYCRPGCDRCHSVSAGARVNDVLRFRMYCEDYGMPDMAAREYRALPASARADVLDGRAAERLRSACPYGLDVAARLTEAHDMLARA